MNDTVVFLGPSLPLDEARALLDADFHPPAGRGDIYRCFGTGVRRIILVDGLFHGSPSVWQREILAALDEGIEVHGSTSMGALRAIELEPYGMVGHGTIFGWYRDGVIEGDDEVALLHGDADAGYRALSEPLVNLRATLLAATAAGTLTEDEAAGLLAEARLTFYPGRSLAALLDGETAAGWTSERRAAIAAALRAHRVDLKRADTIATLRDRARHTPDRRCTPSCQRDAEELERVRTRIVAPGLTGDGLIARVEQRGLAIDHRRAVALRWYAGQWARARGLACPSERRDRHRPAADGSPEDRERWLAERRVTPGEYEAWLDGVALAAWLAEDHDLTALARAWLADHGVDVVEPPDPRTLGFRSGHELSLLVDLLVNGVSA